MLKFTPTLTTNNFMTRMWILEPLNSGYTSSDPNCEPVVHRKNGMIVNPDKHHTMVLEATDHKFSFPVEDSLYLLGMTFDNQLNLNEHVSLVCKKSQQSIECHD